MAARSLVRLVPVHGAQAVCEGGCGCREGKLTPGPFFVQDWVPLPLVVANANNNGTRKFMILLAGKRGGEGIERRYA